MCNTSFLKIVISHYREDDPIRQHNFYLIRANGVKIDRIEGEFSFVQRLTEAGCEEVVDAIRRLCKVYSF